MEGEQLMSINLTDEVRQWIECEKIVEGERIRFDAPKPAKSTCRRLGKQPSYMVWTMFKGM